MRAASGAAGLASRVIARKKSRRADIAATLVVALRSRIKVNSALNRVEPTPLVAEAATAAQDIWGAAMDRNIPEIAIRYGA
jgi:hypothetical protein